MNAHDPARTPPEADAGFTLVEALVSLMLLMLVLMLLPGAMTAGKRGWETGEALARRGAADTVTDFLAGRLAEAALLYDRDQSGRARIAFAGSSGALMFVAASASGPAGAGLYRFELGAAAAEGDPRPRLRMTPFRSDSSAPAGVAEERILPATRLTLRYLSAPAAADEPAAWLDGWPHDDRLPGVVELVIGGADRARTLRVALKLAAPGSGSSRL